MNTANKKIPFLFAFVVLDYVFLVLSAPPSGTSDVKGPFKLFDIMYHNCVKELANNPPEAYPNEINAFINSMTGTENYVTLGQVKMPGKKLLGLKNDILMQLHCAYWNVKTATNSDKTNLLALAYVQHLTAYFARLILCHTKDPDVNYPHPVPKDIRMNFFNETITQLAVYLMILGYFGPEIHALRKLKELEGLSPEQAAKLNWKLEKKGVANISPDNFFDRIFEVWSPKPKSRVIVSRVSQEEMNSLNDLYTSSFGDCYIPKPQNPNFEDAFKKLENIKSLNPWEVPKKDECLLTKIIKSLIGVTDAADISPGAANASTDAAGKSTEEEKSG